MSGIQASALNTHSKAKHLYSPPFITLNSSTPSPHTSLSIAIPDAIGPTKLHCHLVRFVDFIGLQMSWSPLLLERLFIPLCISVFIELAWIPSGQWMVVAFI